MNCNNKSVAIIGAGPAGLMAAEVLSQAGIKVDVYDAMPSAGRKFLMAGKGGLNITHAEAFESFLSRYGNRRTDLEASLRAFAPDDLRDWVSGLGIDTFVGTSGRVFPTEMKAAPLLRAWLHRLRVSAIHFHMRHLWLGWNETGALRFAVGNTETCIAADAVILALGGGSWPQLGSTGAWLSLLTQRNIDVMPLQACNCGFEIAWSDFFKQRFAGQPLKSIRLSFTDNLDHAFRQQGELMLTEHGLEGGLIYAFSNPLRDAITTQGSVQIYLDLTPQKDVDKIIVSLSKPRGKESFSNYIRKRLNLDSAKIALLREAAPDAATLNPQQLANTVKALPLTLLSPRPIEEAISSAGGVCFQTLDKNFMLKEIPGLFCAGEMLDWEAPTGGFLLTACLATGRTAGRGALEWLNKQN